MFAAQKLRACAISFSPLTMQLLLVQPPGWRGDSFIYKAPLQTLLCGSPCSHSSVCRQFLDARPLAASFRAARSCLILFSSPRVFGLFLHALAIPAAAATLQTVISTMGGVWWRPHRAVVWSLVFACVYFWSLPKPLWQSRLLRYMWGRFADRTFAWPPPPAPGVWPGFRGVFKASHALPDGGTVLGVFRPRLRFTSEQCRPGAPFCCMSSQIWTMWSFLSVGARAAGFSILGVGDAAPADFLIFACRPTYNDAFSDPLVLRAAWPAFVPAFSTIPSHDRLGEASPSLPPPSQTNRATNSETRRI